MEAIFYILLYNLNGTAILPKDDCSIKKNRNGRKKLIEKVLKEEVVIESYF